MSRNVVTASACLVAEARARGTRCTTMRSSPPLAIRSTPDAVYLVGSAAGPLGGDRIHVRVHIGPGATLVVRSSAATVALPGVDRARSETHIELEVGTGATLWWLPEPLVVAAGSDHATFTTATLGPGAAVVLRDEVVLGRHGEPGGSLHQRVRVDVDGLPLVRNELCVGPAWGSEPRGLLGDARAIAQTVVVGWPMDHVVDEHAARAYPGVQAASMPLAEGACLVTELAPRPGTLVAARPVPRHRPAR